MPEIRGDWLAGKTLAIRPKSPLILCTDDSAQIPEERAREIGVRAFVMKALTAHEPANTVRNVLDET